MAKDKKKTREKKIWVKRLNDNDRKTFQAFKNVGHLTKEQITNNFVSESRLRCYERDKLITHKDVLINKQMQPVYSLTDKGRELCAREYNFNNFYSSSSAKHDVCLADRYLAEREHQDNWLTESDWRDMFKQELEKMDYDRAQELLDRFNNREISSPDGGFITIGSDGTVVAIAIEVVTNNYKESEKAAKLEFCRTVKADLQMERA